MAKASGDAEGLGVGTGDGAGDDDGRGAGAGLGGRGFSGGGLFAPLPAPSRITLRPTRAVPSPMKPRVRAQAVEQSRMRFFTKGPRSLTRTVAEMPLSRSVT